eukprot:6204871-Pleurochrysis_carterae.AAC.3
MFLPLFTIPATYSNWVSEVNWSAQRSCAFLVKTGNICQQRQAIGVRKMQAVLVMSEYVSRQPFQLATLPKAFFSSKVNAWPAGDALAVRMTVQATLLVEQCVWRQSQEPQRCGIVPASSSKKSDSAQRSELAMHRAACGCVPVCGGCLLSLLQLVQQIGVVFVKLYSTKLVMETALGGGWNACRRSTGETRVGMGVDMGLLRISGGTGGTGGFWLSLTVPLPFPPPLRFPRIRQLWRRRLRFGNCRWWHVIF